jgi:glycosyltransferase involved in cell wall biosynthesis
MTPQDITIIHSVATLQNNSGVTPMVMGCLRQSQLSGIRSLVIFSSSEKFLSESPDPSLPEGTFVSIPQAASGIGGYFEFKKALIQNLKRELSLNRQVILHDHGIWLPSNMASSAVAKEFSCPQIISVHGMLQQAAFEHLSFKKNIAWQLYQKNILKRAAMLHVASAREKRDLLDMLPNSNIRIAPLGTPTTEYSSSCEHKTAVYLGRLHPLKGVELLIDAWRIGAPDDWMLKIVGPGEPDYHDFLNQKIDSLKLQQSIRIMGPLYGADKNDALLDGSLFILPSYTENFGLVVAEALMRGLPTITTTKTPWLDLDQRGCGWTVEPDPRPLAKAIHEATHTTALQRRSMGARGKAWVQKEFSLESFGHRMAACYQEVLNA